MAILTLYHSMSHNTTSLPTDPLGFITDLMSPWPLIETSPQSWIPAMDFRTKITLTAKSCGTQVYLQGYTTLIIVLTIQV